MEGDALRDADALGFAGEGEALSDGGSVGLALVLGLVDGGGAEGLMEAEGEGLKLSDGEVETEGEAEGL
jgi:hypothetical protein